MKPIDSIKYKERYTIEDTKKAMVAAKAGLKRALGKAKDLEKDSFEQIKRWLEKDEDISVTTVRFFERMKKEIKRSLKVTVNTIKHPESLGANQKRNKSSVQVYPTLPTTEEVSEEDSPRKQDSQEDRQTDQPESDTNLHPTGI